MADHGESLDPPIRRPSDAIGAAFGRMMRSNRWRGPGAGRFGSVEVQLLIALRELGWDVVRKPTRRLQ